MALLLSSLIIVVLLTIMVFRLAGRIVPVELAMPVLTLEQRTLSQNEEFRVPRGWSCTADVEVSTPDGWINTGGDLVFFEREAMVRAPFRWGAYCSNSPVQEKAARLREFVQKVEIMVVK